MYLQDNSSCSNIEVFTNLIIYHITVIIPAEKLDSFIRGQVAVLAVLLKLKNMRILTLHLTLSVVLYFEIRGFICSFLYYFASLDVEK